MTLAQAADGSATEIRPDMTIRDVRAAWDKETGLTRQRNQNDKVVWYRYGGGRWLPKWAVLTLPGPNPRNRRKWVDQHDLHHILTGYAVNWTGEGRICAWELASYGNLGWNLYAWFCLLHGTLWGLLTDTRGTLEAWRRGKRCRTLFDTPYDEALLDKTVGQLRAELGIDWI
jgi:hypothetical protein